MNASEAHRLAGTGMPGIFNWIRPNVLRVVKNKVLQSSLPQARLVVAGAPCTNVPRCFPEGSMIQIPPDPPQYTFPSTSTFIPSGTCPRRPGRLPAAEPAILRHLLRHFFTHQIGQNIDLSDTCLSNIPFGYKTLNIETSSSHGVLFQSAEGEES